MIRFKGTTVLIIRRHPDYMKYAWVDVRADDGHEFPVKAGTLTADGGKYEIHRAALAAPVRNPAWGLVDGESELIK